MSEDEGLKYEEMVEDALRGVVRRALIEVLETGLPGEHHFYITFRTDHPGTSLAKNLRERYPNEMTIVLQHQFWNLEVRDEDFEVTLSFSNVPHRLEIPFAAVVAFADPSVRFVLQFEPPEGLPEIPHPDEDGQTLPEGAADNAPESQDDGEKEDKSETGDDEKVVTLDSWRKK